MKKKTNTPTQTKKQTKKTQTHTKHQTNTQPHNHKNTAPAFPGEPVAKALDAADVETYFDGLVPAMLRRGDMAGAEIVVVKGGRVLLEKGYGLADVASRTPDAPRTALFRAGSTAKLFTWTAVMQLVEQGRLDLDTDVNRYLDFRIHERFG